MRPTVSAVITNFDGEHYLPGMKQALKDTAFPFHEIIVTDDASRDGSRLYMRNHWPEAILVTSDRNRGPSPTRNAGIERATGEYILLLDNDAFPFKDSVEPLLQHIAKHPELAGIMPRIILRGDPPEIHCDGARTHFTGQMWLLNGHKEPSKVSSEPEDISSLMGTAMFFRRDDALAIGGFEEDYFFYYEDHDFGTRMFLRHGPMQSLPASSIDHLGGTKNLSFREGASYPVRRSFLTARNHLLFTIRTFQGRSLLVLAPVFALHECAQAVFVLLQGRIEPWFQGWRWNITHLGRTLRKRESIQATRRIGDRAILQDGPLPLHPGLMAKTGLVATARRSLEALLQGLYKTLSPFLPKA